MLCVSKGVQSLCRQLRLLGAVALQASASSLLVVRLRPWVIPRSPAAAESGSGSWPGPCSLACCVAEPGFLY